MTGRPPAIYAIADASTLGPENLGGAVAEMAHAGIGWIQLRAKTLPDDRLCSLAEECHRAVSGTGAQLWMDDRADLGALFPFVGVHVGQADLTPGVVRPILGPSKWIGRSTHSPGQVRAANDDPAVDLIAYGPIFETGSKETPDPTVGVDGLRVARSLTEKPLVAIGGIDAGRLEEVLDAGADSVAMIGAICYGDIGANCRRLLAAA